MALKSLSSASLASSAMGSASPGRNPPLRSRRTSLASLSLSCAVVKPHQAGDAYSMEARVVMRAPCTWVEPSDPIDMGGDNKEDWGTVSPKTFEVGDGPCIRPPNILRSSVDLSKV